MSFIVYNDSIAYATQWPLVTFIKKTVATPMVGLKGGLKEKQDIRDNEIGQHQRSLAVQGTSNQRGKQTGTIVPEKMVFIVIVITVLIILVFMTKRQTIFKILIRITQHGQKVSRYR